MNDIGDIATGIYGLGSEDILYPHSSFMYTGLIVNKIKEENKKECYEIYCWDGAIRKFRSCEIIDAIIFTSEKK
jgi:hypothetical protein